jgi:alkylation response protein AidB-like acyl-CoA dehydrogenase
VGSDAGAIAMRAERRGDHYLLNGVKQFITSGANADVAVVFAVTDKSAGKKGISGFIVDTKTKGYVVARVEEKLGQHASDTAQIVFEDCEVPAANLLGTEGAGYRIALSNLEAGRIVSRDRWHGARCTRSGDCVRERTAFSHPSSIIKRSTFGWPTLAPPGSRRRA